MRKKGLLLSLAFSIVCFLYSHVIAEEILLLDEGFVVEPSTHKPYGWDLKVSGMLGVSLKTNSDVYLYIVDELNYWKYKAGNQFYVLASRDRITSTKLKTNIPKSGTYYIIVSNNHSLLTPANAELQVSYTPKISEDEEIDLSELVERLLGD